MTAVLHVWVGLRMSLGSAIAFNVLAYTGLFFDRSVVAVGGS